MTSIIELTKKKVWQGKEEKFKKKVGKSVQTAGRSFRITKNYQFGELVSNFISFTGTPNGHKVDDYVCMIELKKE